MRRYILLSIDLVLILTATLIAFILRENLEVTEDHLEALAPYLVATALMTVILVPVSNLNRSIWRFSSQSDYRQIAGIVIGICAGAVALSFAYSRLDGVPRSLPVLQGFASFAIMVGARMLHRMRHASRQRLRSAAAFFQNPEKKREFYVLVVGVNQLTEMYIHALAEPGLGRIRVAGILGQARRHVGRHVATHPVLGIPEDIESILDGLETSGIGVERIVLATPFSQLSETARNALLRAENSRRIPLQFLSDVLGFGSRALSAGKEPGSSSASPGPEMEIATPELLSFSRRYFWKMKRGVDAITALGLTVALSPLFLLVFISVAATTGFPVIFWQRRPGVAGKSFWLYKFRTMGPAYAADGRRLTDSERTSGFGNFLRRTRLDELPQLLNILRGDMSFIGPRPLLPRDQPEGCAARLLVRPGITGWAQVVGGRDISPTDKAALDAWYVRNASFYLDLQIAVRTVPIMLFGERVSASLIEDAWRDLTTCGIAKPSLQVE